MKRLLLVLLLMAFPAQAAKDLYLESIDLWGFSWDTYFTDFENNPVSIDGNRIKWACSTLVNDYQGTVFRYWYTNERTGALTLAVSGRDFNNVSRIEMTWNGRDWYTKSVEHNLNQLIVPIYRAERRFFRDAAFLGMRINGEEYFFSLEGSRAAQESVEDCWEEFRDDMLFDARRFIR